MNEDGSVTVDGTASAWANFPITCTLGVGTYKLNGCPIGGGVGKYILFIAKSWLGTQYIENGNGIEITLTEEKQFNLEIVIYSGQTAENLTFYPMIRLASIDSDVYEPYSGRNMFAPTESVYEELLNNVEEIRNAHIGYSTTPPVPVHPLNTYQKWNQIERILSDVYAILLNNFHYYCGSEIYAGDETGLLL